jgi:hypothetical protein
LYPTRTPQVPAFSDYPQKSLKKTKKPVIIAIAPSSRLFPGLVFHLDSFH